MKRKYIYIYIFGYVQFFVTSWTTACQAPLSMEFSRQEYWSGLPFPPPGDLPNPGIIQGVKCNAANKGRKTEMVNINVSRLFFSFYTFSSNKYHYHMQKLQHCLIELLMCVTTII